MVDEVDDIPDIPTNEEPSTNPPSLPVESLPSAEICKCGILVVGRKRQDVFLGTLLLLSLLKRESSLFVALVFCGLDENVVMCRCVGFLRRRCARRIGMDIELFRRLNEALPI